MIRRSTLFLVIIFVVFVAFAVYWQRSGNGESAQEATSTPQAKLFDLVADSVASIAISDAAGGAVQYDEQTDGSWALVGETQQTAKPEEVVQVISQIIGLRALNTLQSPPADQVMGLNPAAYTIEMKDSGGMSTKLEIGAATATNSGYYVRTGGKVYIVVKSTIDQAIELLTTPPILTPAPTITGFPDATATP